VAATIPMLYTHPWSMLRIDAKLLHRFADRYNWDDGLDLLVRCIRHPACSLATALLVYWKSSPHYYRQYRNRRAVPDFERAQFDLLSAIERRVVAGKYPLAGITFDPRRNAGFDWTRGDKSSAKLEKQRPIPSSMLVAVGLRGTTRFSLEV